MRIKSKSRGPFGTGITRSGGMNQMGGGGGGAGGGGGGGGGAGMFGLHGAGLRGVGFGEVPGRSGGGIGKRYGVQYQPSQPGLHGLGAEVRNILTSPDPVGLYMDAVKQLLGMPMPEGGGTGLNSKWDFATHEALTAVIGREAGTTEMTMPWGANPGVTGMAVGEILMRALESDAAFRNASTMIEALGLPTSDRATALEFIGGGPGASVEARKAGWNRLGKILDAVVRYVIGAEGGRAYGDPMTTYKGIGSAAGAPLLSLLLIALL